MRLLSGLAVVITAVALTASVGYGHTFSVDRLSTHTQQAGLLSDDILTPGPAVHISEATLGLIPGDDLNALSGGLDTYSENPILFFSVCRNAVGISGGANVPYVSEVFVEAGATQAAGDVFVTTTSHIPGALFPPAYSVPQGFNMLHINQSDMGLFPATLQTLSNPDPDIDNLNALNFAEFDLDGNGTIDQNVYFSLDLLSPTAGGAIKASDILLMTPGAGAPVIYADGITDIGLVPGDDLDALILLDLVNPGLVDPAVDMVLFSLAPISPTLAANGWGPGDILTTNFAGSVSRVFTAASLGLLPSDDLDALETQPIPEPGTLFLLGTACIAGVGFVRRRRIK